MDPKNNINIFSFLFHPSNMNMDISEFPYLKISGSNEKQSHFDEKIVQFYYMASRKENDKEMGKLAEFLHDVLGSLKYHIQLKNDDSPIFINHLRLLYRMIGQSRDFYFGKGERQITYMMIFVWYKYYPVLAIYAFYRLFDIRNDSGSQIYYGCWKDMKYFCQYVREHSRKGMDHELITIAIEIMNKQIYRDDQSKTPGAISYAAKWVPREKSKYNWLFDKMVLDWSHTHYPYIIRYADTNWIRATNKCKSKYRKMIASLNRILDTVQIKQCSQKWSLIDPKTISKTTFLKQKNAFLNMNSYMEDRENTKYDYDRRQCSHKFKEYFKDFFQAEYSKQTENITFHYNKNTINISPAHFVKQAIDLLAQNHSSESNHEILQNLHYQMELLNKQWQMFSNCCFMLDSVIPMIDISITMCESNREPIFNAIGMACLIAEKSSYGKRILAMDHTPLWINLDDCEDFVSMIDIIYSRTYNGTYANIHRTIDLIVKSLQESKMSFSDISKLCLVLFSDGNYDSNDELLIHDKINEKFIKNALPVPKFIFWNLSQKYIDNYPTNTDKEKSAMVSGTNSYLLNHFYFIGCKEISDFNSFQHISAILNHARYDTLGNYFDKCIRD
jgi:hypothetical protein